MQDDPANLVEHECVLCWIPAYLSDFANLGVEANPEECIQWLWDAKVGVKHFIAKC